MQTGHYPKLFQNKAKMLKTKMQKYKWKYIESMNYEKWSVYNSEYLNHKHDLQQKRTLIYL